MPYRLFILMLGIGWVVQPAAHAENNPKEKLQNARSDYRQAVHQYGADSPQALSAKSSLRLSRRSYHEQRRQTLRRNPVPDRRR